MRFSHSPSTFLSLLAIISSAYISNAKPYPRDTLASFQHKNTLEIRQCANSCGWSGQLCCAADQSCYTDAQGEAQCGAGQATSAAGSGQWQWYTTTYVETDLVTVVTTFSLFVPAATPAQTRVVTTAVGTPQPSSTAVCNANLNEVACGAICCASGQFCQYLGQCANYGGSSANEPSTVFVAPTASSASASNFLRPTSNTVETVTSTGIATTTIPFQTPIGTDGSAITGVTPVHNNGLSGGAIAGIVIGVLAGLFFLLLLCACCCFKSAVDGLLGLLGLGGGNKKRTETTYLEERHSHHGGGAVTGGGRRWFGTRPARVERPPKKSSGLGGMGAVAAFLGTLAVLLGLRRKARREEDKSEYGTGSSYSYYTSEMLRRTIDGPEIQEDRGASIYQD
ncbi:hypothetical protein MMC14_005891 [Varicellaria rhodocarpa]|nr:hypothetical protein [Varicellaria rhodocarpa]